MAAPATTAIQTPAGLALTDGFSTVLMFANQPTVGLFIKTLTPPSLDGEDVIDVSNMHNVLWRTRRMRSLITAGAISFTCSYDPDVYEPTKMVALINNEGSVTLHFSDLSTLDFYGALRSFEPQEVSEGAQPEANGVVEITNWDPVNNVEQGPVMTEISGT